LEPASLLSPFVTLALFCLPALAQTQFSGQITSNVNGASATLANPVYYNETITAVGVSTTGALSCAAYPQITLFFTRAGVEQVLGFVTTSAGSSWTAVSAVTTLQPGYLVTAQLSAMRWLRVGEGKTVSVVLLLREAHAFSEEEIRGAAERAWGLSFWSTRGSNHRITLSDTAVFLQAGPHLLSFCSQPFPYEERPENDVDWLPSLSQ
jgi:hypothetical protein